MDWKGLGKEIVGKGAPALGSLLGGPVGNAVGGLIASVFGADPDDPDDIYEKLSADPDAIVKLKELEANHRERITELYLADIQSARGREVELTRATGKRDINIYVLAWTVVAGFFLLAGVLMVVPMPEGTNQTVVTLLFGGLVSGFSTVLAYFFGSSKSSADKTQMMAGNKK